jgi:hypothetical protein
MPQRYNGIVVRAEPGRTVRRLDDGAAVTLSRREATRTIIVSKSAIRCRFRCTAAPAACCALSIPCCSPSWCIIANRFAGCRTITRSAMSCMLAGGEEIRYFGTIAAPLRGGFVLDGDSGCGAFIDADEAGRAGLALKVGDRVIYSRRAGGAAFHVVLNTRTVASGTGFAAR